MANYANLLATIAANIYTNGNNEVTAAMVKAAADAAVASLGSGYQFLGIATPDLDPGTPDQRVFYFATQGDYTDFGFSVASSQLAVFWYDTQWHSEVVVDFAKLGSAYDFLAYGLEDRMYSNAGWMDSAGISVYFSNSSHLVIPVKPGQSVSVESGSAGIAILAFLSDYAPIQGNGESYSLIGSRIEIVAPASLVVPAGARYLFVGIVGNGIDFTPKSLSIDGIDLLSGTLFNLEKLSARVGFIEDEFGSMNVSLGQGYASARGATSVEVDRSNTTRVLSMVIRGNYIVRTSPGYAIRAVVAFDGAFIEGEIPETGIYAADQVTALASGASLTEFEKNDSKEFSIITFCKIDPNEVVSPAEISAQFASGALALLWKLDAQNNIGRAIVMGDSIQYGLASYKAEGLSGVKEVTEGRISDIVAKILRCPVDNIAGRGTGYVADTRGIGNGLQRANATDFNAYDLAIIALGINDYIQGVPIGSIEDATPGTLIGNAIGVYRKIISDNPLCKIVVFAPYNSWGQVCDDPDSEYQVNILYGDASSDYALGHPINGQTLQNVISAIREVCEAYRLQVVELSKTGAVNLFNIKEVFADGLHPTVEARKMLASEIAGNLKFR